MTEWTYCEPKFPPSGLHVEVKLGDGTETVAIWTPGRQFKNYPHWESVKYPQHDVLNVVAWRRFE